MSYQYMTPLPPMPTSTIPATIEQVNAVFNVTVEWTVFCVALFLAFLVIEIIFSWFGHKFDPIEYEDVGEGDGGGAFGGPTLSDTVDWDELERRASGSLEHDAMV